MNITEIYKPALTGFKYFYLVDIYPNKGHFDYYYAALKPQGNNTFSTTLLPESPDPLDLISSEMDLENVSMTIKGRNPWHDSSWNITASKTFEGETWTGVF